MTREERENALHCLKVMIDEEVCEECNLYGTTGTDHCEADCVRVAIEALKEHQHYKDLAESYGKTINKLTEAIAEQASSSEEPNNWIPLTKRPMTVEDSGEYVEGRTFTKTMLLNCPLPKDGQWVLISHSDGYVHTDIFHNDEGACYFEGFDIDEVEAWKPAEPYKVGSEAEE